MAIGCMNVPTNSKIENDIVELKNKDLEIEAILDKKSNTSDVVVKSMMDTSIRLTDAKDASMLLRYSDVNLLKPWTTSATTQNGITVTPNSDGSFTVTGTCTSSDTTYFIIGTFSGIPYGEKFYFKANAGNIDWAAYMCLDNTYGYGTDGSYSCKNVSKERVSLAIRAGYTVDKTFYPMISLRNTNACVPYSGYTITACGKNLFPLIPPNQLSDNEGHRCTTVIENDSLKCTCIIANSWIGTRNTIVNLRPNTKYRLKAHLEKTNENMKTYIEYGGIYLSATSELTRELDIIGTSNSDGALVIMIVVSQNGVNNVGDYAHLTNIILTEGEESYTYEKSISSKVFVDNTSKFPITGLNSYNELTNVYNLYGAIMEVCYATNESGQTILDSIANINNKTGSTDISTIGDGTITGAIKTLQEKIDAL